MSQVLILLCQGQDASLIRIYQLKSQAIYAALLRDFELNRVTLLRTACALETLQRRFRSVTEDRDKLSADLKAVKKIQSGAVPTLQGRRLNAKNVSISPIPPSAHEEPVSSSAPQDDIILPTIAMDAATSLITQDSIDVVEQAPAAVANEDAELDDMREWLK